MKLAIFVFIPLILSIGIVPAIQFSYADSTIPSSKSNSDAAFTAATFADKYKDMQFTGKRVSVVIKIVGESESSDPAKRAKEIRYLQSYVLKFLSFSNAVNVVSNQQKNEITAQIDTALIPILEQRSDVISVTVSEVQKTSKENLDKLPPKKQQSQGRSINEIQCVSGFVLIQKYDGSPACVKPTTAEKLVGLGWGTIEKEVIIMEEVEHDSTRPNILLIVADDLGYSDLSMYGGEINTPVIDKLASQGMTFYNHHTSATCSPTRSMFLTGTDNHLAGLGTMGEWLRSNQIGKPGYEGYLNDNVVTVASLLKDSGYHTYMAGKWHLGNEDGYRPHDRGFEETFTLIEGSGNHFSDLGFYPGGMSHYFRNGEPTNLPDNFYSTDAYTNFMIDFIEKNDGDEKPLFIYLPYTSPHWPLQAPQEFIQKYEGKYEMGWDKLREQRFEKQKELGIISANLELPPRDQNVPAWDELTPQEQQREAKKMTVYSAMMENMDWNIGKMIQYLKDIDEYDNTLVIFFSDNGAEDHELEIAFKGLDEDEYLKWIEESFDNSIENMGNSNSFISTGKGWAQVSNTPHLLYKARVSEGGISTPLIIKHPTLTDGEKTNVFVSSKEITPTILDVANVEHPGTLYDGHAIHSMLGKSLLPFLEGKKSQVYSNDEPLGWELFDSKALFYGNYKILNLPPPDGDGTWKLYNISEDPRELIDISVEQSELFEQMIKMYEQYAKEVGVVSPEV